MGLGSVVAIYFVVWWTMLFVVLPFGVRSQAESGEVTPGTEPGAPVAPHLLRKVVWTSIVAAPVAAAAIWLGGRLFE